LLPFLFSSRPETHSFAGSPLLQTVEAGSPLQQTVEALPSSPTKEETMLFDSDSSSDSSSDESLQEPVI